MTNGTATFVKKQDGWEGDAAVYKLDPPLETGVGYVIVSAVDLPALAGLTGYRTSETMAFPCDENGDNVDFGEVAFVPHKSHVDCLADIDYVIQEKE